MNEPTPPTALEIAQAKAILARAALMDPSSPAYLDLENAAARLRKTAKKRRRNARAREQRSVDSALLGARGLISEGSDGAVAGDSGQAASPTAKPGSSSGSSPGSSSASMPEAETLRRQRRCYVCMQPFHRLHHYYHRLCQDCGDASLDARDVRVDLAGRRALVTGGRIKVGFATALRLLRDGASVHVTSRFPKDALRRYREQPDANEWIGRLTLHGCDFRDLRALLALTRTLVNGDPFDILINNAAQTVWRPPEYYRELRAGEDADTGLLESHDDRTEALLAGMDVPFPRGARDGFGEPLDLRRENSWTMETG